MGLGILFIIYAIINSFWLGEFLKRKLNLEKEFEFIFGLFFLIFLISLFGAVFVVLYKIKPFFVFLILTIISAISFFLGNNKASRLCFQHSLGNAKTKFFHFSRSLKNEEEDNKGEDFNKQRKFEDKKNRCLLLNKINNIFYPLFFILYFFSFFLLFQARTGKFILSPWEVIHPIFLYIFGLLTFLVLRFIFLRYDWRVALLFIILLSFLLHSYLPIVYQTGFGGDKWRHLGAEKWLQGGNIYSPSLFGEEIEWQKIGPIKIPAVFLLGNKTSYASQWALTIILSWLFKIDVFWIDLFLGFILCSLFIPILFFQIGRFFSSEKILPLLLAFLPNLFYSFQVYGAITLPNSLGFLFFLFVLIFWLKYLTGSGSKLLPPCFILTLAMYFNYILYFILLTEIGFLFFLFKRFSENKNFNIYLSLAIFCFIFSIPFLDKFSGFSGFIPQIFSHPRLIFFYFVNFIKKIFAFSSLYSDPGFITQGNFIFTQTYKFLAKTTLFHLSSWIKWSSILVWLFIFYGFWNFRKSKGPANKIFFIFSLFLIVSLASYFIGRYLMKGSILLNKRSDLFIAFLMIIFLGWGIVNFLENESRIVGKRAKIFAVCLLLTLISCAVYGAGPTLQVVTKDELKSAQYLWQEIGGKGNNKNSCVLANTWPLLALEYVSSHHLITGGFPVYQEYAQPERVQLFNNMSLYPSQRYMEKALEITGAKECYFMTEERWWNKRDKKFLRRYQEIFGDYKQIGDVYIFKFFKNSLIEE